MKTNYLIRNVLPRGSGRLLKRGLPLAILLCLSILGYGQDCLSGLIAPADGTDVALPVELEWAALSGDVTVEIYECIEANPGNSLNLNQYELDRPPIAIVGIADDLSGVTYNPCTNTLFMVVNGSPKVYETDLNGVIIRSIDLIDFEDTEGIVHIEGNRFAVSEERRGRIAFFDIEPGTSVVNYTTEAGYVQLPDPDSNLPGAHPGKNDGLEGVSYDPASNLIHTVQEKTNKRHYSFTPPSMSIPFGTTPSTLNEPCDMTPTLPTPFGLSDLAGIHHLGLTQGVSELNVSTHALILSHESKKIAEIDESCNEISSISLNVGGANGTLSSPFNQPEGVTMDNQGRLYVVGEPSHFFVFSNPNVGTSVHTATLSSGTSSYVVPSGVLVEGTEYCWRVGVDGQWSETWSFTPECSLGGTCNDNDACTTGDVYDANCNCVGTFADADGDGVCDANDACPGTDDALIGTSCNDGDACTTGDVYDANCNCAGTFADADGDGVCDADDACPGTDDALIGTACNDGDACTTGDVYDANCNCAGTFADADGDGVCDANDACPGMDDALIGTTCNDGDPNTENDVYDENCTCAGTAIACLTDITVTSANVSTAYFETSNLIQTQGIVDVDGSVDLILNAGQIVKLYPGFSATDGDYFHGYIDGCEQGSGLIADTQTPTGNPTALEATKTESIETNPLTTATLLEGVRHYPNPFKDKITIEFSLGTAAEISLIVSDMNGKKVVELQGQEAYAGIQQIELSTASWIPGMYAYQIVITDELIGLTRTANGKLIKL